MNKILTIGASLIMLSAMSFSASADERTMTGVAIGAGSGAVVAGPVGAVVGGVVGAVVGGPRIPHAHYTTRCWRDDYNHRHCRY